MRAEFQILAIPFTRDNDGGIQYVVFQRSDANIWQFIAGGGEEGEEPIDAVKREVMEEMNITQAEFYQLSTTTSIPINCFKEHKAKTNLYVIPEYSFGLEITNSNIQLSSEHADYKLVNYEEAINMLKYDGNKTALWELNKRIDEKNLIIASS